MISGTATQSKMLNRLACMRERMTIISEKIAWLHEQKMICCSASSSSSHHSTSSSSSSSHHTPSSSSSSSSHICMPVHFRYGTLAGSSAPWAGGGYGVDLYGVYPTNAPVVFGAFTYNWPPGITAAYGFVSNGDTPVVGPLPEKPVMMMFWDTGLGTWAVYDSYATSLANHTDFVGYDTSTVPYSFEPPLGVMNMQQVAAGYSPFTYTGDERFCAPPPSSSSSSSADPSARCVCADLTQVIVTVAAATELADGVYTFNPAANPDPITFGTDGCWFSATPTWIGGDLTGPFYFYALNNTIVALIASRISTGTWDVFGQTPVTSCFSADTAAGPYSYFPHGNFSFTYP